MWCQTRERKPERTAQRINVGARIHWAASKLLRAGESRCANKFSVGQVHVSPGIGNRLRQAEIDDFHLQVARQHYIARFQIAMNQPVGRRSH